MFDTLAPANSMTHVELQQLLGDAMKNLPDWLDDSGIWHTMDLQAKTPRILRFRRDLPNGGRFYVHKIFAGDPQAPPFLHPHAAPTCIKILRGTQYHSIGFGSRNGGPPRVASVQTLGAGDTYTINDPMMWHAVVPLYRPSYSLMVTGRFWEPRLPAVHSEPSPVDMGELTGMIRDIKLLLGIRRNGKKETKTSTIRGR